MVRRTGPVARDLCVCLARAGCAATRRRRARAAHSGFGPIVLDAEWHILGAGFMTLLILGEGVNLLPGFAGRPLRSEARVWANLVFGNLAVLLRVAPVLLSALFAGLLGPGALASSGLAGLLAVALFTYNIVGSEVRAGKRGTTLDR
jgi:hypothetical protein